jgi:hypothetical protein
VRADYATVANGSLMRINRSGEKFERLLQLREGIGEV